MFGANALTAGDSEKNERQALLVDEQQQQQQQQQKEQVGISSFNTDR